VGLKEGRGEQTAAVSPRPWRGTILERVATVLRHDNHACGQYTLRLAAPDIARQAQAGHFVHLRCDSGLPLRRPMSIMRADANAGWLDVLYKAHGVGTHLLSHRQPGEQLAVLGPIGVPFKLADYRRRPLLIGGGVGIPPMVFLAEHMKLSRADVQPLVVMGSEIPFPFRARPSTIMVPGLPEAVIASMPLLEDWGIASRLASGAGFPGCFEGLVTDLARAWLDRLRPEQLPEVEIFSCGPTPMLRAVQLLAAKYGLPGQVSLEEYMACAVGGCAGCAAPIHVNGQLTMKRVCVDGPVFEVDSVMFD
jgi:dihydroorotate dehydrogenase electron transfer subunit